MKEIGRGAEAILYHDGKFLIKDRIKKSYRIAEIDILLRSTRTKKESKLLEKSAKIIPVPKVIETKGEKITMEFIDGKILRDILNNLNKKDLSSICNQIGESIKKLHDSNIIHGDLTTSNMILHNKKIYFIDFGLGFISQKTEDKAVDLHLLRQALNSKHYDMAEECFNQMFKAYNPGKDFIERFNKVEGRGRYKSKIKTNAK